jgi:hypothetical protein
MNNPQLKAIYTRLIYNGRVTEADKLLIMKDLIKRVSELEESNEKKQTDTPCRRSTCKLSDGEVSVD